MAMTANGELGPSPSALSQSHPDGTSASDPEAAPTPEERPRMRSHSGLSALIQAATSQLSNLAEGASSDASDYLFHSRHRDGYASSNDTDLRSSTQTQTPTIVPEEHGRKLSFPELLMTLLLDSQNSDILTFLPDGKFFAIRSKEFSQKLMIHHLHVSSFVDFLELIQGWGFTRINSSNNTRYSGIQVFRHPHFRKGYAGELCRIRFGQNPTDARVMAIPDRARIEYSFSDDSGLSTSKRRLSPSHVCQVSADVSQRQRVVGDPSSAEASDQEPAMSPATVVTQSKSPDSAEMNAPSRRSSVDFRSHALAITTEKLNIQCSEDDVDNNNNNNNNTADDQKHAVPLIDGGVERATHTIVADAIETLLRDEGHTRETYLKHEKELSISSLPGVVPISKQLFSPSESNLTGQGEEETAPSGLPEDGSKVNTITSAASDSKLEAAAALLSQASATKAAPPLAATFG
jgi:hypothetical protein